MAATIDATSTVNGSGTTWTWSHTCAGNKLIVVIGWNEVAFYNAGGTAPVVTYNGVTMTADNSADKPGGTQLGVYTYRLDNPTAGAHNIVVTHSGGNSASGYGIGISLNNAATGGLEDNEIAGLNSNQAIASVPITTVSGDLILMFGLGESNSTATWSASTGLSSVPTFINGNGGQSFGSMGVGAGTATGGSQTPHLTSSTNQAQMVSVGMDISGAATPSNGNFLAFM